jgi:fatty acid-binding protein DegV
VGGALGVKPVLSVVDGQIKLADTARGRPGAFVAMFKNIEKMGGVDPRYGYVLLYSDEKGVLAPLHHYMHENLHMTGGHVARLGPVIASHAGPGCAGLVFVTKE